MLSVQHELGCSNIHMRSIKPKTCNSVWVILIRFHHIRQTDIEPGTYCYHMCREHVYLN